MLLVFLFESEKAVRLPIFWRKPFIGDHLVHRLINTIYQNSDKIYFWICPSYENLIYIKGINQNHLMHVWVADFHVIQPKYLICLLCFPEKQNVIVSLNSAFKPECSEWGYGVLLRRWLIFLWLRLSKVFSFSSALPNSTIWWPTSMNAVQQMGLK